ncbi:hypothetical protein BRADI_4g02554v3 [Brachypodium distachyon]|nr:hypothetical protein BRADI_4g02554v3 [Brachypodium distachyon]
MADSIMRISLADNTYHVIKTPVDTIGEEGYIQLDMGRSEKGVYFVWIHKGCLWVWILKESRGEVGWILKNENDLKFVLEPYLANRPVHGHGPWVLEDINYNLFRSPSLPKDDKKTIAQEKIEWEHDNGYDGVENFFLEDNEHQDTDHDGVKSEDMVGDFYLEDSENRDTGHDGVKSEDMVEDIHSEDNEEAIVVENVNSNFGNDDALGNGDMVEDCYLLDDSEMKAISQRNSKSNSNNGNSLDNGDHHKAKEYTYWHTEILGFHPYEEIIFLSEPFETGLAYHLNSSEIEVPANMYPEEYVYMPCWIK